MLIRARAGRAPFGANIARGAMWSGINTLVTKLATIAVTVFVVRIVSPRDFGVFAVALVVYTVVSAFSELGLSACIARRDLNPTGMAPVVVALSMASSVSLAITMAVAAHPLAVALGAPDAEGAIRVLSLSVLFSCLTTVPTAMLTREFRQGRIFAATAVAFIPSNGLLVLLALNGDGAMAFAWSRLAGQLVAGTVLIASVRPWYWPGWDSATARRALAFGLPLAGANLLNYTLLNADYAFIGSLLGPALLGTYSLAFNVASWSTSVLGAAVNGVAMPAFSDLKHDPDRLREAVSRWLAITGIIAFPVAALTAVLAPDLIHVLYGEKWSAAAPILAVLALYGAIFVVTLVASNLLVGTGRAGWVFIIQAVWLACLLPAVGLGVSGLGVMGAAYAHVVVIALVVVPVFSSALRRAVLRPWHTAASALGLPAAGALAAAGVALVVGLVLPPGLPRLLGAGAAGSVAFVVTAWRAVSPQLPAGLAARLHIRQARPAASEAPLGAPRGRG